MTYPHPVVLRERAEARAILFWEQEFDLETALKPLREYAVRVGIVEKYGAAETMAMIYAAFNFPAEGPHEDDPRLHEFK